MKRELRVLEASLRACFVSGTFVSDVSAALRLISNCLDASDPIHFRSVAAMSFSILYRICEQSSHDPVLRLLQNKIKGSTPTSCLVPVTSLFTPASDAIEAEVNISREDDNANVKHWSEPHVDYSPCGRYIVANCPGQHATVLVLDAETRDCVNTATFHKEAITALKFASSSKIVLGSCDHTVLVWHWQSDESPGVLRGHSGGVRDVALSTDGTKLFSGSEDCTVKTWDLMGGGTIATLTHSRKIVSISVHGDTEAVVLGDGYNCATGTLEVYRTYEGQRVMCFRREADGTYLEYGEGEYFAFSKDGKYLCLTCCEYSNESKEMFLEVIRTDKWTPAFEPMKGHTDVVQCIAFSSDTKRMALCSGNEVRMWSVLNGRILGEVRGVCLSSVSFSPNGKHIASTSANCVLQIWNIHKIENPDETKEVKQDSKVEYFALSGDGNRVTVLTTVGKFIVRNAMDGTQVNETNAPGQISCIAINHLGCRAAYGTKAGTISVWNI